MFRLCCARQVPRAECVRSSHFHFRCPFSITADKVPSIGRNLILVLLINLQRIKDICLLENARVSLQRELFSLDQGIDGPSQALQMPWLFHFSTAFTKACKLDLVRQICLLTNPFTCWEHSLLIQLNHCNTILSPVSKHVKMVWPCCLLLRAVTQLLHVDKLLRFLVVVRLLLQYNLCDCS